MLFCEFQKGGVSTSKPPPPLGAPLGIAKIFDLGGANQISLAMKTSEVFKEEFLWDKDIVEWKIRSRGLVWHLTESFLKGEGLNQKLQMKISKWGDLSK